jgi:hypothetical protein
VSALAWVANKSAWGGVLIVGLSLLPAASPGDPVFTIPDYVFDPLAGVLALDRYFPVATLLVLFVFDVAVRVGMFGLWLAGWVWKNVRA